MSSSLLALSDVFSPQGPLAAGISGYRQRSQQLEMAERVAAALKDNRVLVAEAGTGTGKTYAYLVPALLSGGKVIGGGMPVGAMIGKSEWMDALDGGHWRYGDDSVPPAGVTYFAGTFVRHPLTMAAMKASLVYMKNEGPALQERLNTVTEGMVARVNGLFDKYQLPYQIGRAHV